jgi:hypothetical protein
MVFWQEGADRKRRNSLLVDFDRFFSGAAGKNPSVWICRRSRWLAASEGNEIFFKAGWRGSLKS